jgi:hypothetical protein
VPSDRGRPAGGCPGAVLGVRFDGNTWQANELAKAGACLWEDEQDYTGLAALDPSDPNVVFISTTIDPRSDSQLGVHEIFRGQTKNSGHTWAWTPITSNSSVDNLRPLAVSRGDSTVLVWFRGTMTRSQHYDSAMVGTIIGKDDGDENIQYLPMKSTLPKLESGTYNVFAFFWADPAEDNRLIAGLTADRMTEFRPRSCQTAEPSQFAQPIEVTEGKRLLYRAFLGRIKATAGQPVDVSVRDNPEIPVFAGVGYQKTNR